MMAERRNVLCLSDEQIDEIAERAAEKAVAMVKNEFYNEVGRSVVSRFIMIVGIMVTALVAWFSKDIPMLHK